MMSFKLTVWYQHATLCNHYLDTFGKDQPVNFKECSLRTLFRIGSSGEQWKSQCAESL